MLLKLDQYSSIDSYSRVLNPIWELSVNPDFKTIKSSEVYYKGGSRVAFYNDPICCTPSREFNIAARHMDLLKVLLQMFHCYVVALCTGRRVERSYPTRIPKQWKSNVYTAWSGGWNPSPSRNSEQFFIHRNWSINRVRVQKQGIKSTEINKKDVRFHSNPS